MAFLILARYFSIQSRRLVLLKQKSQRIEFAGDDIVVKIEAQKTRHFMWIKRTTSVCILSAESKIHKT